jgi:predicted TIM-barrel fold metal-dependent hydrolase
MIACSAPSKQDPKYPEKILLKDLKPKVLHKVPVTHIEKAKYPVIDMHTHAHYATTPEELDQWVEVMDATGVEKAIVHSNAYGEEFDVIVELYSKYPDRFDVWCGLDYTGYDQPGFGPAAVAELERCFRKGAKGVGELGDKGKGMFYCEPQAWGMHFDDPRMDPILDKCGELGMPVNIHTGDVIWFYEPLDETNDGLMMAYEFKLDKTPLPGQKEIVDNAGMAEILENAVRKHPDVTFISCHFAMLGHDFTSLGEILDRNPNLYVDNSAQYAETSTIPRFTAKFYEKYQDRVVYGTDWVPDLEMNRIAFRILETEDEHFYALNKFGLSLSVGYHWTMNGLGLSDTTLKKVYRENALKILHRPGS